MKISFAITCLFLCVVMTSCYRMPTDEDYTLRPMTNNPEITKDKPASPVPGVGY